MTLRLHVVDTAQDAARVAADELVAVARAGGAIALSGGSAPRPAYELAAAAEPNWSDARLYWSDERCVPPGDERSNYRLACEALLERLEHPPAHVHRVEGELEPDEAARRYDELLRDLTLDLALQGIGPDGHTASLFPGSPALAERERLAVAADPGLEPFVPRVTMTIPMLRASRRIIFLVVGEAKADAARRAFAGEPGHETPASLVRSHAGETVAILDRAAATLLDTGTRTG